MLGRHHLLISLATVTAVTVPFLEEFTPLFLVVFAGTAVGSLIPDVDSPGSTIFHSNVKGLEGDFGSLFNNLFAPLFPLFGYTTRYLIYQPGVFIFDLVFEEYSFKDAHRSFSHSLLGVFTMTAVTGIYMGAILAVAGFFRIFFLLMFLVGYMGGASLHLLEDSCTKTGIVYNSPFSDTKIRGELVTSSKPEHVRKPRYLFYVLGSLSALILILSKTAIYELTDLQVAGISLIGTVAVWIFFLVFAAGLEME